MTYNWTLTSLKKTSTYSIQDVVIQAHWTCVGTDADGNTGVFNGVTPFNTNPVDPAYFIAYNDLSEATVMEWIQEIVVDGFLDHVYEQIDKQINENKNPIVEVTGDDLPWMSTNT